MKWWRVAKARLRWVLLGEAVEQDMEEELRCHLEMLEEVNLQRGMKPEEARRQALRSFGNLLRVKEMARDVRGGGMMETILQDIRYGIRVLRKNPGFTGVVVLALALGIGANTAVFSVVNGVLLRPLPYNDPDRIITIWEPSRGGHTLGLTDAEFFDFRDRNQAFEVVATYATGATTLTGNGEPERLIATWVSVDFFSVLSVQPALGRFFAAEEDKSDPAPVAILSYGLWKRRFGTSQDIIGQQLSLNGISRTIIGVMPQSFQFDNPEVELWLPLGLDPANVDPGNRSYNAIGRLKPGVLLERARVEMNTLAAQLTEEYKTRFPKGANSTASVNLIPLKELLVGEVRQALFLLLAAVGFVLLIACANVANLLLARGETRQKEIAVRLALGASRLRIIQQLLTESVILSVMGGVAGSLLAYWGIGALLYLAPASLPRIAEVSLDSRVLIFTLAVSLLAGIVFGLAPGLQITKPDLQSSLKEGGRTTDISSSHRAHHLLVISELALAAVLLAGAGLMVKSFVRLVKVDPGFDPHGVLTARINLPQSKYPQHQQVDAFYGQLLERLKTAAGVESVGTVTVLPLSGLNSNASFEIEGRPYSSDKIPQNADYRMVSTDYFRAMGISLLKGRLFAETDAEEAPGVVIINESMSHTFWPGEEPLEKRINLGVPGSPWLTVVGVVKDVKHKALDSASKPEMYFSHTQNAYAKALGVYRSVTVVVRGTASPLALTDIVKSAVRAIDKDVPISKVETMERVVFTSVGQPRFLMVLLAIFAVVALVLAAVGVYGVMAYTVTHRKHEIGVRMALGAAASDVLQLIVGHGMTLAVIGTLTGLGLSVVLTRLMTGLLFEVRPTDPLTYIMISLLLLLVALVANLAPALRAVKVDPVVALRNE